MIKDEELKHKYGEELQKAIMQAFSDYGLDFEWKSGWYGYGFSDDPIYVNSDALDPREILLALNAIDEDIQPDLVRSDYDVFGKFVMDTVEKFMDDYSGISPYNKLNLTSDNILTVGVYPRSKYNREFNEPESIVIYIELGGQDG